MKKAGTEYISPLIDTDKVIEEWPYFKLMLVNNYDSEKEKNTNLWKDIFKNQAESFPNILK